MRITAAAAVASTSVAVYVCTLIILGPDPWLETHGYESRPPWEDEATRVFFALAV